MTSQTPARPLIIHIDDNDADLELGQEAVEECCGATVEYRGISRPESSLQALEALADRGAPRIALIIIDVNLPRIDGWEIVKFLKGHPVLHRVPLVMMSGSNSEREMAQARVVGVEYRVKPGSVGGLCEVMRGLVDTYCG